MSHISCTRKEAQMPRTTAVPMDAKQQLADAIAAKKAQLRRMEERLRAKEQKERLAKYVRVGKVVEACGLLEVDNDWLIQVLTAGLIEAETERTGGVRAPSETGTEIAGN
jgi:hypothetical protein